MEMKLFEKIYFLDHQEMRKTRFSLYVQFLENDQIENSLYWIMSDVIPEEMLSHFNSLLSPKLVFETQLSEPNYRYLEELLDFISEQILADSAYGSFFYPEFFFDDEFNVRPEVCRHFNHARQMVRMGELKIINMSHALHLFYIGQLIRVPKRFIQQSGFSVERISRKHFELCLIDFKRAEEYVEIYSHIVRFKLMRNRKKTPEYFIALDEKNQPILVIAAMNNED
jgi:hypothetical protein